MVMLCFVGRSLLRYLECDGLEVYTDRDTPCLVTTCFGIAGWASERDVSVAEQHEGWDVRK